MDSGQATPMRSQVKFMVSDLSDETYRDDESVDGGRKPLGRMASAVSPGDIGSSGDYFTP